jgi:hypothetical protein
LEEQFGGTAKNKQPGELWPPSCPDNDFGIGQISDLSGIQMGPPEDEKNIE